jgi:lactam utilization protein B
LSELERAAFFFYDPEPKWRSEKYAHDFAGMAASFAASHAAALQRENAALKQAARTWYEPDGSAVLLDSPEAVIEKRKEAAAENARMRAALEHYASDEHWTSRTGKVEGTVKAC